MSEEEEEIPRVNTFKYRVYQETGTIWKEDSPIKRNNTMFEPSSEKLEPNITKDELLSELNKIEDALSSSSKIFDKAISSTKNENEDLGKLLEPHFIVGKTSLIQSLIKSIYEITTAYLNKRKWCLKKRNSSYIFL